MQRTSLFASQQIVRNTSAQRNLFQRCQKQNYATLPKESVALRYHKHGAAERVLQVEKLPLPERLEPNQVLIKMLAAPLNPADFNMIEGTYGTRPQLPAVVGNEGVGVVTAVGSGVSNLSVNDRVIPSQPAFGTLRTYAVAKESEVTKVSSDIPVEYAATLAVNPCTAYRMLEDFVSLKPGDTIVQNGANSMVGHAVIQLAKLRGVNTINIIRNRPDVGETIEKLKYLGGTIVVTDEYGSSAKLPELTKDLPKPKLALNCVGGDQARLVTGLLDNQGVMVTYGGMSRKPITIPTGPFIFKDISLRGFWVSRWVRDHSAAERQQMLDNITDLIKQKKLVFFFENHKFTDVQQAVSTAADPMPASRRKVIVKLDE